MHKIIFSSIFSLLVMACGPEYSPAVASLDFMPGNHFAIIKINNFTAFNSDLKNNHFLTSLEKSTAYRDLASALGPLGHLQSNTGAVLGFYKSASDSIEYLLSTPFEPELFVTEKISNLSKETLNYRGGAIEKYGINGQILYSMVIERQLLLSSSDSLLKVAAMIPGGPENPAFHSLYATSSLERNATLFLHLPRATHAIPGLLNSIAIKTLPKFSEWISLDIGSQQDYLSLTGLALPNDSLPNYVNLFSNASPLPLTTPAFAPESTLAMAAFALGDQRAFSAEREVYTGQGSNRDSIFHTVEEIGVIWDTSGKLVLLNTYGADNLSQFLNTRSNGSFTYMGHDIYTFDGDSIISERFSPLVRDYKANFYTILENALVFSSEREPLINLLSHYHLGTTFDKTALFEMAKKSLANEANILVVTGEEGLDLLLKEDLGAPYFEDLGKADLSNYSMAAQVVAEGSFYHISLMLKRLDARLDDHPTAPWYTIQLDAPIATDPQMVINHRNNRKEIVVQDEDNNFYLISTEGKVLWKKALKGRIQGAITQVDLYRNGRLQLAFTTDSEFLVLDRNGKVVPPFSISYEGGNLNPLAVFDYDQNRNYRFVVTQGTKVSMYDRQGKNVRGFTYSQSESPILPSPQHIRLGSRDYLLFRLENGKLEILNRQGKTRIKVAEKIDFSGNGVYAYKNQLALTDKQGTLYMINEKGNLAKTKLNLNQDHGLETTSKTMAFMNENVLNIKGKEVQLDYGVYTAPKIFYIYDKIYVSVTDIQSSRTYLFDSNAVLLPGFPVAGSSTADLADMDNDRKLELVTRRQDNSLVVYRIY